jgi:DNA helicase-2/ATP-dependent DNA helicase PcrA
MSFFDRKEVRDVLAFLRLCQNPDDESALLRVVNVPPRGIGKTTIDRALEFATVHKLTAHGALQRGDEIENLNADGLAAYRTLRGQLDRLSAVEPGRGLVTFIREVLAAAEYRREVDRCYPDPLAREQRWQAVDEVLNFAENYVRKDRQPTLTGFLEQLALSSGDDRGPEDQRRRDAVTLMTLHAAKGLEFQRVFLVGLEEGTLPHLRSVAEDTVAEERRLCYVDITRAMRWLTLTMTKTRARHGHRSPSMPSRFYYELKGAEPPDNWVAAGHSGPTAKQAKGKGRKKATARGRRRRR